MNVYCLSIFFYYSNTGIIYLIFCILYMFLLLLLLLLLLFKQEASSNLFSCACVISVYGIKDKKISDMEKSSVIVVISHRCYYGMFYK